MMRDISIVIPARNAADTIESALRSVLSAGEVSEVIVVDDRSTDGTGEIACRLGDPRLRVVSGPGTGIAGALNTGFQQVRSQFVARCDADDQFPQDRLGSQLRWLSHHPDFVAVSGGFTTMFADGTRVSDLACEGAARDVTERLLEGNPLTHLCTWLIRSDALRQVGGAREWFRSAEDLDLQFRLAAIGRVWHEPKVAYLYRLHDASLTHRTDKETIGFYDAQARRFALQRKETGADALQRGAPPVPPSPRGEARSNLTAFDHASNHAIGAAWREFETGKTGGEAYGRLCDALSRHPFSLRLWRHVLLIKVKRTWRRVAGRS